MLVAVVNLSFLNPSVSLLFESEEWGHASCGGEGDGLAF